MVNLEPSQHAALARLFSSGVLKELASRGESALFTRLMVASRIDRWLSPSETVADAFEFAFRLLRSPQYRIEYVYKSAIAHKILLGKHSLSTSTMLSEFRVGSSKVDIAILNGTAAAYEIKSERDTLGRLEGQLADYRGVFAKVNVVAGEDHIDSILKTVPPDVGVIKLSSKYRLQVVREAADDPSRTRPRQMFASLQTKEAVEVLRALNKLDDDLVRLPNTRIRCVLDEVFGGLDPVETHRAMVRVLKSTRSKNAAKHFILGLPASLQAVAVSTPLVRSSYQRLHRALSTSLARCKNWS